MTNAIARITVELEIAVNDTWGNNCTIEQIKEQAKKAALGSLAHALNQSAVKATIRNVNDNVKAQIVISEE